MTMRPVRHFLALAVVGLIALSSVARADVKTTAARETAEYIMKKFSKDAAEFSVDVWTEKIAVATAKHGDEVIEAVRKVGPQAFKMFEKVGEQEAKNAVKIMAKYGEDGVEWLIKKKSGMAIFEKYGEQGAQALVKQKGIAEPVIEKLGEPAIGALNAVDTRNARRLAQMVESGELEKIGSTPEVMGVIRKYGDSAMNFIWDHKGKLAVGAAAAAFVANPKPFIDGTVSISNDLGKEIAKKIDWTLITLAMLGVAVVFLLPWYLPRAWRAVRS